MLHILGWVQSRVKRNVLIRLIRLVNQDDVQNKQILYATGTPEDDVNDNIMRGRGGGHVFNNLDFRGGKPGIKTVAFPRHAKTQLRNTRAGSVRLARQAGNRHEAMAVAVITASEDPNTQGSRGLT